MFLQRNTAGQVFVVPGSLRAVADGSAVTSTATITVVKDGTSSAGAGTLTHISGGAYKYAPTQGETDCKILGYVLEATGAITLAGSIRTTNADPDDAAALGLTRIDGTITSRMASYTQPTGFLAATFPTTVASTTNIAVVGSVTGLMTSTIASAVWDEALSAHPGGGSAGQILHDNLNATITSRMASYTQPAGFLAATFPTTVASTTNITAGTITTVTDLTNLPAIPNNWLTAAGIATDAGAEIAGAVWNTLQSAIGEGATMGQLLLSYGAYTDPWIATGTTLLDPAPTVNGFTLDTGELDGAIVLPSVCAVNLPAYRGLSFRLTSYNPGTGAVVLADPLPTAPPTDAAFSVEFAQSVEPDWYTAPSTTGLKLASDGLDSIVIETGINARQAISLIAAANAGLVSGAATGTVVIKGTNVVMTRITATTDADGNRSVITLSPPA